MTTEDTNYGLPYRPCVGITLFNRENKVFVGERIDHPGSWQMPQGGIDEGETAEDAFFREMKEEIGTNNAKILAVIDEPLRYNLPYHLIGKLWAGKWGGQEQTWIAARYMGSDDDINIYAHNPPEFEGWQWMDIQNLLDSVVPFKRATYVEVIREFSKVL